MLSVGAILLLLMCAETSAMTASVREDVDIPSLADVTIGMSEKELRDKKPRLETEFGIPWYFENLNDKNYRSAVYVIKEEKVAAVTLLQHLDSDTLEETLRGKLRSLIEKYGPNYRLVQRQISSGRKTSFIILHWALADRNIAVDFTPLEFFDREKGNKAVFQTTIFAKDMPLEEAVPNGETIPRNQEIQDTVRLVESVTQNAVSSR